MMSEFQVLEGIVHLILAGSKDTFESLLLNLIIKGNP